MFSSWRLRLSMMMVILMKHCHAEKPQRIAKEAGVHVQWATSTPSHIRRNLLKEVAQYIATKSVLVSSVGE